MANRASSGGIGCLTVIGIVFVVLKVLSVPPVSDWSWLWVLSPFWFPAALAFSFAFLLGFVIVVIKSIR